MSEKRFKDVQPKYMAMLGELYGRVAGYIPYYSDKGYFGFITTDAYKDSFNGNEPEISDCTDSLFVVEIKDSPTPTEQVATAFIDYVAEINMDQTPEQNESMVVGFIAEHVMSSEVVVSNVIKQINASDLALPDESKIILPPKKIN